MKSEHWWARNDRQSLEIRMDVMEQHLWWAQWKHPMIQAMMKKEKKKNKWRSGVEEGCIHLTPKWRQQRKKRRRKKLTVAKSLAHRQRGVKIDYLIYLFLSFMCRRLINKATHCFKLTLRNQANLLSLGTPVFTSLWNTLYSKPSQNQFVK